MDHEFYILALCLALSVTCSTKMEPELQYNPCNDEFSREHGSADGLVGVAKCSNEGYIDTISYTKKGNRISSISFTCQSSLGKTPAGTFGRVKGKVTKLSCSTTEYISHLTGEIIDSFISSIGVKCKPKPVKPYMPAKLSHTEYKNASVDESHVKSAYKFDDECYTTRNRRPTVIVVRYEYFDDYNVRCIQVKYENVPIEYKCRISHIEVKEKGIHLHNTYFVMIGFTSGLSCSLLEQQLNLDIDHRFSQNENIGSVTSKGVIRSGELNTGVTGGYDNVVKFTFSEDISGVPKTYKGTLTLDESSNTSGNTTGYAMGTTINYEGPGLALVVAFRVKYSINGKMVPALYHYTCAGGSKPPEMETIEINGNILGIAFFLDFHYKFKDQNECQSQTYPQECVTSIKLNNYVSHLDQLEEDFLRCFNPNATKILFY